MHRTSTIATFALMTACGVSSVVPSVPNPDGRATEILAIGAEGADAPDRIYVIDLREAGPPLRFELANEPQRFEAYLLFDDVAALQLEPGMRVLDVGVPPTSYDAWSASLVPGVDLAWASDPSPSWLGSIRIPTISRVDCLLAGRCLVDGECESACGDIEPVAAPIAATPPAPTCAEGWAPVVVSERFGVVACDPIRAATTCALGEMRLPGEVTCTPVGRPCTGDEFPPIGAMETVLRVAPRGSMTGDGSDAEPFDTVGRALAAATDGARIVVAAGTYPDVVIDTPVTISGVCTDGVVLGVVQPRTNVTIEDVTVSSLRAEAPTTVRRTLITGGTTVGLSVASGASIDAERVAVDGPYGAAVHAAGRIDGRSIAVRGADKGVRAADLGTAILTDVRIESSTVAVSIERGAATLVELAIEGGRIVVNGELTMTDATITDLPGVAMHVVTGTIALEDTWFSNVGRAIHTVGGKLTSTNLVVSTTSNEHFAIWTVDADVEFRRTAIIDVERNAMFFDRSYVRIEDLVADDVGHIQGLGRGVVVPAARSLDARRMHFANMGHDAVLVARTNSATVTDVFVESSGMQGCFDCSGVCLRTEAKVYGRRFEIVDVLGTALRLDQADVDLADVAIARPVPNPDCDRGPPGTGVHQDGATTRMARFTIDDPANAGIRLIGTRAIEGSTSLRQGIVRGAEIGLEVNVVFDFTAGMDRVDLRDNDVAVFISEL